MPTTLRARRSQAFTLTELLVVIAIIIVLIGILLPVVSKIKYAAYAADTQNEISQISNACTAYYSTFNAYPGPFSNDQIETGTTRSLGIASLQSFYINNVYGTLTSTVTGGGWPVTGAQNLLLGLMGGLRLNGAVLAFAPAEVGLGPLNLSAANPTRTPTFFSNGSNYLSWCQLNAAGQIIQNNGAFQNFSGNPSTYSGVGFTDPSGLNQSSTSVRTGGNQALDAPIPVFVDRYPNPMPILYLRARTGAPGIIWDNNSVQANPNGSAAYYQYDLRDITPYTSTYIGLTQFDANGNKNSHNLVDIGTFPPNYAGPMTAPGVFSASKYPHPDQTFNAGQYFMNTSITPTNSSSDAQINYTGRPRSVDQFILIAAGPDGIYGTADDITSFGSVSQ